ncbi:hypothetical protein ACWFNS_14450 [Oerskovia enterophila]|uniref:Chromosome partition protein Smc n=1 Tax=Oerskovia enterophila TaxID=43678 RepID=A0A163QPV5_9CELL|nr:MULTISPECIES: hypothetical protein [Oerskovia]KRC32896.1 hypothetical protein ASE15_14295 [Oerskovia sp. Root22]KRD35936.1 hypothetical protein ASE27_14580 [Oerskovia sp. Root918]KZM34396.1 hypothetical protein OJAG_29600 [Oerskovia enterophila]OCI30465.1 hypothetical protein OERS_28670 [Oerskovia enterophila]
MTSPKTSGPAARLAAASFLALAMMLPLSATASAAEVSRLIEDTQCQVDSIGEDLEKASTQLSTLPSGLRLEVEDAVANAQAATDEANAALAQAATDEFGDGRAVLALTDAQVALDAASAQVRYVADKTVAQGADVGSTLRDVQNTIDHLRGETSRAAA